MFAFGAAYGALLSACAACRIRTVRVRPQVWQASMLPLHIEADTKDASRAWALTKYDRELFVRGRGKKPDHNRTDATAIACWASKTHPEGVEPTTRDRTRKAGK